MAAAAVTKRYGDVTALDQVSITLQPGRLHAIVGENGAGKSTLLRIFSGQIVADEGALSLGGMPVRFASRGHAIAAGVGLVPQRPALIDALSLVEHAELGRNGLVLDRKSAARRLAQAIEALGLDLPLDRPVGHFGVGQRQLAELALALAANARILLLDEPSSALAPPQVERLVGILRRLASAGRAVALVTHRITEVLNGSDEVTVLRQGRAVFNGPTSTLDADRLAALMVGRRTTTPRPGAVAAGRVRLRARKLGVAATGARPALADIDLEIRAGEIVGIAGIVGSGQDTLAETLAGLRRPQAGSVELDGVEIAGRPDIARQAGLAFIPEDRDQGIDGRQTVAVNANLLRLGSAGFGRLLGLRNRPAERRHAAGLCAAFGVSPPNPALATAALSGGNRQKLLVGRELADNHAVIIAHGPTQGLDRGAAAEIRAKLAAAARAGAGVLLISSELDELLELAQRIMVLAGGRITVEFDCRAGAPDETRLGRAIAGLAD